MGLGIQGIAAREAVPWRGLRLIKRPQRTNQCPGCRLRRCNGPSRKCRMGRKRTLGCNTKAVRVLILSPAKRTTVAIASRGFHAIKDPQHTKPRRGCPLSPAPDTSQEPHCTRYRASKPPDCPNSQQPQDRFIAWLVPDESSCVDSRRLAGPQRPLQGRI